MKTKLLFLFSLPLFVGNCFGQITFQKVITTPFGCYPNAVQQTTDGGYIIAGIININNLGYTNFYLIKTNEEGDTLWTRTFKGDSTSTAISVQQTIDSGYIIAGITNYLGQSTDVYVIKINSNGDISWSKTYGGVNYDQANFVQQTNDGGYIITGHTQSYGTGGSDVYLVKINAIGDITWTKTYGGSYDDVGTCVKQTSDSGYIICGYTYSFGAGKGDVYLIKTNINGDTLWTKTYGGTDDDFGIAVQQTNDSGYIITGYTSSFGVGVDDIYLIKTNSFGDTLWTKTYGGIYDDISTALQQTADSGYIIAGYHEINGPGSDYVYLIKTKANGDTLWTKTYGESGSEIGNSVMQTSDGGYIVAGYTASFGSSQTGGGIYLIKTDANGNTNCNENPTSTIVASTITQVGSPHSIVGSGGITTNIVTFVGRGGSDSTLCLSVGINEQTISNSISIYPNPAENQFTIYGLQFTHRATVTIYNMLGEVVSSQYSISDNQYSINVSSLSSGIYFVRVADEKESWVGRFVKE